MNDHSDNWHLQANHVIIPFFGPIHFRDEPGGRAFAFRVTEDHLDQRGQLANGAHLIFADHYVGSAGLEAFGVAQVTIQLQTNFIATAGAGDWVEGRARLIEVTDRLGYLRGSATVGGRVISTSDGIWKHVAPLRANG